MLQAGCALFSFANAFRNNDLQSSNNISSSLKEEDSVLTNASEYIESLKDPIEYVSRPGVEEDYQFEAFLEIKVIFFLFFNVIKD